ncbi:MAG: hypothetical protein ACRC2B_02565 [Rubrivivax sp.]
MGIIALLLSILAFALAIGLVAWVWFGMAVGVNDDYCSFVGLEGMRREDWAGERQ